MNTRPFEFRTALSCLALVAVIVAGCGDDSAPSAESSSAVTTAAPATTEGSPASTASPATTMPAPATTAEEAPATTAAPATTGVPVATWVEADVMPSLAYIPCCASNYSGEPSPEIPTDAAAALTPGIYRAVRDQPAAGVVFDPSTIDFSLAPFVACGTPDIFCEDGAVDGDVGVGPVAREVSMPLTDDVRVVVSGFECVDAGSNIGADLQGGTGTLFAQLQTEFEAAYFETVAPLLAAQTPYDDYASIFATPLDGFSVVCNNAGLLQWQGSAGPNLLMQILGEFDEETAQVVVPISISIETLHLTAYEVAADGTETLYFYAGFLS